MTDYVPQHPQLRRVWERLNPAAREARYQEAMRRKKVLERVQALCGQMSERAALRKVGVGRTKVRRWQQRYQSHGMDGLIDWRWPPQSPLTAPVVEAICTMRRIDPNESVEAIIEHVARYHQVKTNATSVKEVLKAAGLERRPGPAAGSKRPEQRLEMGGMRLLEAAVVETGYLEVMVKGVQDCLASVETKEDADGEVDTSGRDEYGRFLPSYNERLRKREAKDIGPGFESVEKKRERWGVERLHLGGARQEVLERKVLGLLVSPLLGTGRWDGLRQPRGELLGELCGYPYMPSTLDLFFRELKYLGVSSTWWESHARLAADVTRGWGEPRRAAVAYVDGSSKEVHTQLFSHATKVSQRNQVVPGLDLVAVHSGVGVPLYQVTYSGRAPLVTEVPKVLKALEPALAGSAVGRIVVIDAEGNSVLFLLGLEQQSPARAWVTRLRPSLLQGKKIFNRSNYSAYRNGDRVRTGLVDLSIPESDAKFRVRVIEVERRGKGRVTYLGASTLLKEQEWKATAVADLYFDRWPMQEANFRAVNQAVQSKQVHGYGKHLVANITVLNELEELTVQMQRQQERLEQEEPELAAQERALREVQKQRRRSERRLQTLTRHLEGQVTPGKRVTAKLSKTLAEQRSVAKMLRDLSAAESKAQHALDQAKAQQEQRQQRQQERVDRFRQLDERKQIYRHDVELDSLWGVMQVGLVFLVTYLLKVYFDDARMDPVTFLERLATLPARRNLTPHYEIITFEYNRRDPDVMALLLAHHEAINARALRMRSGRILRIHVDPAPKPTRPPPAQHRTNSADRFHRRQPKV